MSSYAHAAPWKSAGFPHHRRGPRRGWEIAGVILGFIFFWPAALAYLVWKFAGRPVPTAWRDFYAKNVSHPFDNPFRDVGRGTGNAAFEDYRQAELARLDEERRRLDDEARAFRDFVDELKRAKDREEFDAFMQKRRNAGPESPTAA